MGFLEAKNKYSAVGSNIMFFLIWPFGTLLYSLYYYDKKESRVVFALFAGLFGYSLIASSAELDLYRVLKQLEEYSQYKFVDIGIVIKNLYSNSADASIDLYRPIMNFTVSRFTSNGNILLLFYGLVYGFLYSQTTKFFKKSFNTPFYIHFGLFITFSSVFGLHSLAGVRFGTAFYLYTLGMLSYFENKKQVGILILAASVLVHYGYIPAVLMFLVFVLVENNRVLIKGFFLVSIVLSMFLSLSISDYISSIANLFGTKAVEMSDIYSTNNDFYVETINSNSNNLAWYIKYNIIIPRYFMLAFMSVFIFFKDDFFSPRSIRIFYFLLTFIAFNNIIIDVPDFGIRYLKISLSLFVYFIYLIVNEKNDVMAHVIGIVTFFVYLLLILYSFREIMNYTPWTLYLLPTPFVFLIDVQDTILYLFK